MVLGICCDGNKTPANAGGPSMQGAARQGAKAANEVYRLTDFISSVGVQVEYNNSRRTLYICDQNPKERRITAYNFNGYELKKAFINIWPKTQKPWILTCEHNGPNVYAHVHDEDAKDDPDQVWKIECDLLNLTDQVNISQVTAGGGKLNDSKKWVLACDEGWLLLMVCYKSEMRTVLHRFKNRKYLGKEDINANADHMTLRGDLLVMGSVQRKCVFAYTFNKETGEMKELHTETDVFNGDFALLDDGQVVILQANDFMLTSFDPKSPGKRQQVRLTKTVSPVAGMEGGVFATWDRTHREIILMKMP